MYKLDVFVLVCIISYTSRAYRFLPVAKNHRAVQCDLCDPWVHIACNNLTVYTYQKLKKHKSPWYCICCFRKELPYGSTNDTQLKKIIAWRGYCFPKSKNNLKYNKAK